MVRRDTRERGQEVDQKAALNIQNPLGRVPTPSRGGGCEASQRSPKGSRHWQQSGHGSDQVSQQRPQVPSWEAQGQHQGCLGTAPPSMSYRDFLQAKGQQLLQRRGSGSSACGPPTPTHGSGAPPGAPPRNAPSPSGPAAPQQMLPAAAFNGPMSAASPVGSMSPGGHQYPDGSPVHSGGGEDWSGQQYQGWRQEASARVPGFGGQRDAYADTSPCAAAAMGWSNAWGPEGMPSPAAPRQQPYCWAGSPCSSPTHAGGAISGWPEEGSPMCSPWAGSPLPDGVSPAGAVQSSPCFWQLDAVPPFPQIEKSPMHCTAPPPTPQAGLDSQLMAMVMPQATVGALSSAQIAEMLQAAASEGGQYED